MILCNKKIELKSNYIICRKIEKKSSLPVDLIIDNICPKNGHRIVGVQEV